MRPGEVAPGRAGGTRRGESGSSPTHPTPEPSNPSLTPSALSHPADCKYKFENWGACDPGSGTKARQGTLKKARYNAQCQETIRVTKPCTPKTKAKAKGQQNRE